MQHTREHHSILARGEKRLLIRMAQALPKWISSDHLTVLALAGMTLAGLGFLWLRWSPQAVWIPIAGLAINWFGDSLDGTVARVRATERPRYGFYVDHVVDIVGATLLLAGIGASTLMSPGVALALLVAYLLVSAELFLATAARLTFRLSFAGVGPTELRIALAAGTLFLGRGPVAIGPLGAWLPFDIAAACATGGLLMALIVSAARNTAALHRLEPLPTRASKNRPVTAAPRPRASTTTA